MTKRATVILTHGDPALAGAIICGLQTPELRRLRAELGVRQNRDALYWQDRIAEARREYRVKPMPAWKQRFWGALGLLTLLFLESVPGEEVPE